MKLAIASVFLVSALIDWGSARAQTNPFGEPLAQPLPENAISSVMQLTRKHITAGRFADGSHVPPETAAELAQPILPVEDGRRVMETGRISAWARWCAVEWEQRVFSRMMRAERAKQAWSQKQIVYIAMLHGVTMRVVGDELDKRAPCTPMDRAAMEATIAVHQRR